MISIKLSWLLSNFISKDQMKINQSKAIITTLLIKFLLIKTKIEYEFWSYNFNLKLERNERNKHRLNVLKIEQEKQERKMGKI